MLRSLAPVGMLLLMTSTVQAVDVKGRVEMPDTCSPSVSPAVVSLEPIGETKLSEQNSGSTSVRLINQHGLQFEPRVQVARVGQTIRFTNQDAEQHNVHSLNLRDFDFNRSMAPNARPNSSPPSQV